MARGATLTVEQCWRLSQLWYPGRLAPNWHRRDAAEKQALFAEVVRFYFLRSLGDTAGFFYQVLDVPNPHVDCGLTISVCRSVAVQRCPDRLEQGLDDYEYNGTR